MEDKYKIAFNTNYVASLTGASIAQLNDWDKKGIISPSILKSDGRGTVRLYSFKDIVAVKTVVYLRTNKVPLTEIKIAIDYLKNDFNYSSPLSEMVLLSNGKDVLAAPQQNINDISTKWMAANKYGQLVMRFVVPMGAITHDIDSAIAKYNERIKQAEDAKQNNELIPFSDLEEKLLGISNRRSKKRA